MPQGVGVRVPPPAQGDRGRTSSLCSCFITLCHSVHYLESLCYGWLMNSVHHLIINQLMLHLPCIKRIRQYLVQSLLWNFQASCLQLIENITVGASIQFPQKRLTYQLSCLIETTNRVLALSFLVNQPFFLLFTYSIPILTRENMYSRIIFWLGSSSTQCNKIYTTKVTKISHIPISKS